MCFDMKRRIMNLNEYLCGTSKNVPLIICKCSDQCLHYAKLIIVASMIGMLEEPALHVWGTKSHRFMAQERMPH